MPYFIKTYKNNKIINKIINKVGLKIMENSTSFSEGRDHFRHMVP